MTSETPLEISVQQLNEMLNAGESLTILDVREPQELAICKLENSLDIPMQSIPDNLDRLRDAELLVVVCHSGMRSWQVTQWLRQQGFAQAQSMAGGIDVWSQEVDDSKPRYS